MQEAVVDIETDRLERDAAYLEEVTTVLLDGCNGDADHVELRRTALRMFPALGRATVQHILGRLVGHAATVRVEQCSRVERDVTDVRLDLTPVDPIDYPPSYGQLDENTRALLIAFCESEIDARRNGPQALDAMRGRHGWAYTERTFYVGPWKAARMRCRRREQSD